MMADGDGTDKKTPKKPQKRSRKSHVYSAYKHCDICDYKSIYPHNLIAHRARHYKPSNLSCKECSLNFMSVSRLDSHICQSKNKQKIPSTQRRDKRQEGPIEKPGFLFKCRLCYAASSYKANIIRHLIKHRCNTCRAYFATFDECARHRSDCKPSEKSSLQKGVSGTKRTVLTQDKTEISYTFNSIDTLMEVECLCCHQFLNMRNNFQDHICGERMQKTRTEKKVKSVPSGKVAPKKAKSKKEKLEGWDEDLWLYCCKKCEYSSVSPLGLVNHRKKHRDDEPILEDTAELLAKRLKYVREREESRTTPRMAGWDEEVLAYKCECGFATPTPIALLAHSKYSCAGKKSNSGAKTNLQDSSKTIVLKAAKSTLSPDTTTGQSNLCPYCDTLFKTTSELATHLTKHYIPKNKAGLKETEASCGSEAGSNSIEDAVMPEQVGPKGPYFVSSTNFEMPNCSDPKELVCSMRDCAFKTTEVELLTEHLDKHFDSPLMQTYTGSTSYTSGSSDDLEDSNGDSTETAILGYNSEEIGEFQQFPQDQTDRRARRSDEEDVSVPKDLSQKVQEEFCVEDTEDIKDEPVDLSFVSTPLPIPRKPRQKSIEEKSPRDRVNSMDKHNNIQRGLLDVDGNNNPRVMDDLQRRKRTHDMSNGGNKHRQSFLETYIPVDITQHESLSKVGNEINDQEQQILPLKRKRSIPRKVSFEDDRLEKIVHYDDRACGSDKIEGQTLIEGQQSDNVYEESATSDVVPPKSDQEFDETDENNEQVLQNRSLRFGCVRGDYSNVSMAVAVFRDEESLSRKKENTMIPSFPPNLHRCSICRVLFENYINFHHHMMLHKPEDPLSCSVCKSTYDSGVEFMIHLNRH